MNKKDLDYNGISFLSKLSHELKNPIGGIRGISEHMKEHWHMLDDSSKKKCVESILKTSIHLGELVELILKHDKNQSDIKFSFVSLDLVGETKKIIKKFKELRIDSNNINIELIDDLTDSTFKACIDPFWYGQLLENLLSNALNYSNCEEIKVKLETTQDAQDTFFKVSVIDKGPGIPVDKINNLFTPYNRGIHDKNDIKGTGLGLTICQEIVDAHKGNIRITNNHEIGATVEFSLPAG